MVEEKSDVKEEKEIDVCVCLIHICIRQISFSSYLPNPLSEDSIELRIKDIVEDALKVSRSGTVLGSVRIRISKQTNEKKNQKVK